MKALFLLLATSRLHFPTTHLLIPLTSLNHSRAGTFPFPWQPLRAPATMHDSHYCLWLTGHKFHKSFSPGLIGQTLNCYSLDAKTLRNAVPLAPDWVHPASESPNWFIGGESQRSVSRSSRWKWSKSRGSAQRWECECPMTGVDVPCRKCVLTQCIWELHPFDWNHISRKMFPTKRWNTSYQKIFRHIKKEKKIKLKFETWYFRSHQGYL